MKTHCVSRFTSAMQMPLFALYWLAVILPWIFLCWLALIRLTDAFWVLLPACTCAGIVGLAASFFAAMLLEPNPKKKLYENERFIMLPMFVCRMFVGTLSKHPLGTVVMFSPVGLVLELILLLFQIPWLILSVLILSLGLLATS